VNVLIDTNILLDYLLQREPFSADADRLFLAIAQGGVVGYASVISFTNIFYIAHKHTPVSYTHLTLPTKA
jgi:predicted nucleic acid-binding protein